MAKQRCLAQFNKASGAFICFLAYVDVSTLNGEFFTYSEVNADPEADTITGRYPDFAVIRVADLPTRIYERDINASCAAKISKEYTAITQVDRLRNIIQRLARECKLTGPDIDAMVDMNSFIDQVKESNKILKQSYIDNPDFEFVTLDQEAAEQEAQLDGGLHELVHGPREITEPDA